MLEVNLFVVYTEIVKWSGRRRAITIILQHPNVYLLRSVVKYILKRIQKS